MTRQLLVPLDGSKAAEAVLPIANDICKASDLTLRFLTVLDGSEGPLSNATPERAADLFATYVRELCERLGMADQQFTVATALGDPAEAILRAAPESELLALSSHGRGGFRATVFGSVADRVIRRSPVPTLVVRATEPAVALGTGPVVVTLDGSPESERALRYGRALAGRVQRQIVLLRAYSLIPLGGIQYFPLDYLETLEKDARAALQHLAHPDEGQELVNGPTVEAIVEAAERLDASLLVMASSGKGLAKRFALGSTTDGVLHQTQRPVLVVPREREG